MEKVKVGDTVSFKNYARLETLTGKVICISQVKDCLYEEYIGKTSLNVKEKEYSLTTKVWLDDVIKVKREGE